MEILALDIRTAFLMNGLLYLLLPVITWFLLSRRHALWPVALWCGGGLLLGISLILIGLRGHIPDAISIDLANFILLLSHFSRIQSLRMDLLIPWRWRWVALATLLLFGVLEYFEQVLCAPVLRAQYASLIRLVMLWHLSNLAGRIGHHEQSRSALWIAWVYRLVVISMIFRFCNLMTAAEATMVHEGKSAQFLVFSALLSAVIGHLGYLGLALDRSMRRELKAAADLARDEENRRLSEQIAQLDRQRSLGEMSASLGHELNQPLTAILSNAQIARRGLMMNRFNQEQIIDFLDKIALNTQRASQIIDRIRSFIQPTKTRHETVDLALVVHEVVSLVEDERRHHGVILFLESQHQRGFWVTGDPIQLSQIILNILRNALQALTQVIHREIHIDLERHNECMILRIHDSGPGLAPEVLVQTSTPFFTTKLGGLGMGLTISRSIAEQHGGNLTIINADQGGALVTLELPALESTTHDAGARLK